MSFKQFVRYCYMLNMEERQNYGLPSISPFEYFSKNKYHIKKLYRMKYR